MAFIEGLCDRITLSLNTAANEQCITKSPTGFADAILSDVNTNGFTQIKPDPNGSGHIRTVQVNYMIEPSPDDVSTAQSNICDPGTEVPPREALVTPNLELWTPVKFIPDLEYRKLCADTDYMAQLFSKEINALRRALNRSLVTIQLANFGNFYGTGSNAAVSVPLLTTGGAANYPGMVTALEHYRDLGCGQKPMVIGGGRVSTLSALLNLGCCNDVGIDLNRANNDFYFFRDQDTKDIWTTANDFAIMMPGVAQLVWLNRYKGEYFQKDSDVLKQGTIADPYWGIEYDLKMKYIDCSPQSGWQLQIGLIYSMFYLPDLWDATDPMSGANGTLHFTATTI